MDLPRWVDEHWIGLYFGVDILLFAAAVLLWKPGTRPVAGLLFVLALIPPLAFVGAALTPESPEST